MSHEIEIVNGVASMVYTGETPWHSLGHDLSHLPPEQRTPDVFLKASGCDWGVTTRPLYFEVVNEFGLKKRHKVTSKALVRDTDNKVLSVISKDWNPVQNAEAFDFFSNLCETGKMEMHTAGSLMGGRKVWALAKVNDQFELKVGGRVTHDRVEGYLLLTNPHEYGKSIDARFTAIRVVCNNTHSLAMGKTAKASVAMNHRQPFDAEKMQELLGVAHLSMDKYREHAEFLAGKRYTLDKAEEYFAKVFPFANGEAEKQDKTSKMAKASLAIVETQPGADFAPGTWWNAFNAVTFATDHLMGNDADKRLNAQWYGYNVNRKREAMNQALEYARAA